MNNLFEKNRERELPTFANINLLGPCNVDCYFCLGKDINNVFKQHNQTKIPFWEWKNFTKFLDSVRRLGIKNIYITGQNTDALVYKYLNELIDYLQLDNEFDVGIRTNGYLAKKYINTVNKCRRSVGYSIHSLSPNNNWDIMRRRDIPDWEYILTKTRKSRVSIVLNKYNQEEFWRLLEYISYFKNVQYIQVRRICTDTRDSFLEKDAEIYEEVFKEVSSKYDISRYFYNAECFNIFGKEVVFWRTVKTSIGSVNYYTDGSYTDDYFIIEGYMEDKDKNQIVEPLEGYWRK